MSPIKLFFLALLASHSGFSESDRGLFALPSHSLNLGSSVVFSFNQGTHHSCTSEAKKSFTKKMTAVASITIPSSEHGLDCNFFAQFNEENGAPVEPQDISFQSQEVTITFAIPQTGSITLRTFPVSHQLSFTNQTALSIPAEFHSIHSIQAVTCQNTSGQVIQSDTVTFTPSIFSYSGVIRQSADIYISFATPQSGNCIVFGA